jgi:hypothetical protein
MGTNGAPLLVDISHYSYEAEFIHKKTCQRQKITEGLKLKPLISLSGILKMFCQLII